MVIIELNYKKPIEQVDAYLAEHRYFLQRHYDNGTLIASGPKNPRTGGIIVANSDKETMSEIIKEDPFYINEIADYNITEFEAVKLCKELSGLNS